MIKTRNAECNLTIFLQGDLADFNLLSGDGLSVTCHSVMFVGLSQFLSDLVGSCGRPGGLPRLHHHRTLRCSEPSLHWNVNQFISNFLQKKYIKVGGMVTQSNWVVDASITQNCRSIRFKSSPITLIHCEIIYINPAQCSFIQ